MISRLKQQGAAAVELALLLPPLVLIAFGTAEFGRGISYYNTMVKSVRDGARHLTLSAPGDAAKIAEAKCLVVYGSTTTCSGTPLVPDLTLAMVSICDRTNCVATHNLQPITDGTTTIGVANLVTVKITGYTYTLKVPNFFGPDSFSFAPPTVSQTMMQVL